MENKVKELKKKIKKQDKLIQKKEAEWDASRYIDFSESWNAYCEYMEKYWDEGSRLSRELRLIKPYTFNEDKPFGDMMTLEDFIGSCQCGGFIDDDGFGYYSDGERETDITIHPSDVMLGEYRKDFTHVCWYNK